MSWLAEHGFTLLQSAGIIGSLLFTGLQLNLDARARRVENRLKLTQNHREIWRAFSTDPALVRVLDNEVDLESEPVTEQERSFVTSIILHMNSAFTAYEEGMAPVPEGFTLDVAELFAKPIPSAIWKQDRRFRDKAFCEFVQASIDRAGGLVF